MADTTGDPLDVLTPLHSARDHAAKSFVSWVIAAVLVAVVAHQWPGLLGWPAIEYRIRGKVVHIEEVSDGTLVVFEGFRDGSRVQWGRVVDDNEWSLGETTEGWVTDEGFHDDVGLGWLGPAGFLFLSVVGALACLYAGRRLVGILIAEWDVRHGNDSPRLGYAALVDNPSPRAWRDVLLLWDTDPKTSGGLADPDAIYLADDETGQELRSPIRDVHIRQAWIDTGKFSWTKPRWVGLEGAVFIPHRRALLAAWVVRMQFGRDVTGPTPMEKAAPDLRAPRHPMATSVAHDLRKMFLGRAVAVVAIAVVSGLVLGDGDPVRIVG